MDGRRGSCSARSVDCFPAVLEGRTAVDTTCPWQPVSRPFNTPMTISFISSYSTVQIAQMSVTDIRGLASNDIGALSFSQIAALTTTEMTEFSSTQLSEL